MILFFDIGNTITSISCLHEHTKRTYWNISSIPRTEDEYIVLLNQLFESKGFSLTTIHAFVISSVVPEYTNTLHHVASNYFHCKILELKAGVRTGIHIRLHDSHTVGSNLIACAAAAYERYKNGVVIIDCSTATTLSVVDPRGNFLGGTISAGLEISKDAIINGTAKLSSIPLQAPKQYLGKSTSEALQSGIVLGHAALIDGLLEHILKELNFIPEKILLTGYHTKLLKSHLKHSIEEYPHLLFDGLMHIYTINS